MILCMSDYPWTLLEFQKLFPDELACARHLERIRWQEGYKRPYCGQVGDPFRIQAKLHVLESRQCLRQTIPQDPMILC